MGLALKQSYEDILGDALEHLIREECLTPEDLAHGLNARNIPSPNGERWTVDLLKSELARLGS